jgi:hypothetical protein
MPRGLLGLAVLLTAALPVTAQPPGLPPKKLTVRPAAAPKPALRYLLLPEMRDLTPGNAALAYQRAHNPEWWQGVPRTDKDYEALEQFLETPLSKLAKSKKVPKLPWTALFEIDQAARRDFCDWEMLPRLRKDGIGTLMADVQSMRTYAYLLQVRARLELLEGKYDKALYTYQTLLAMSRHIAEGPTAVNALVGLAVGQIGLSQLHEFIEQPGTPNLYWALTSLPHPFIDIRRGLEAEKLMVDVHFPELKRMEKGPLTAGEMDRLVEVCCNFWAGLENAHVKKATFANKIELTGKVLQAYPTARQALIDQGRTSADVDALPMLQVVVLYHYQQYRIVQDDMHKWIGVPYPQAQLGMKKVRDDRCDLFQKHDMLWPFGEFLPAVDKIYESSVRLERRIAALRCLEAVRLYAADHGKLPQALEDIAAVPIPVDPITGRNFQYTAVGDVFTLFGPPPTGQQAYEGNVLYYQITLKR